MLAKRNLPSRVNCKGEWNFFFNTLVLWSHLHSWFGISGGFWLGMLVNYSFVRYLHIAFLMLSGFWICNYFSVAVGKTMLIGSFLFSFFFLDQGGWNWITLVRRLGESGRVYDQATCKILVWIAVPRHSANIDPHEDRVCRHKFSTFGCQFRTT